MKYENKVEVNGTKLNVYTEGEGKVTIVFMAGRYGYSDARIHDH